MALLVSTPYMDEASLCDRVGLIQSGNIMEIDTPKQIVDNFSKNLYAIKTDFTYRLLETLRNYQFTSSVHPFGGSVHYTDIREESVEEELQKYLNNNFKYPFTLEKIKANIEDCFMELLGKN